ncbi:MAG: peptidoglycan-associated lipoprotein Pal [Robiginitomaculum sp.]
MGRHTLNVKLGLRIVALSGLTLAMSACATKPKPVVETPAPVAERVPPKPVFKKPDPAPVPVATPAPQIVDVALPAGPTPGSVDDFMATAGDRVFFGYNQYNLTSQAREVLRSQAQWMSQYGETIVVVGGHADERGTREYNLALGARRADAVKGFLVSQGVNPSRITTVSYGKERPMDGRSTEEAWALNRNGHTAIVGGANS